MKGLFLFIKNNRIIYKVSIVSILILMLISVVQINPSNMNSLKKGVSASNTIDYYIEFRGETGNIYVNSSNDRISESVLTNLGISSTTIGAIREQFKTECGYELDNGIGDSKKVLVLDNADIAVLNQRQILKIYGSDDTYIYVKHNTVNNLTLINTTNIDNEPSGIMSEKAPIHFIGDGKLNISYGGDDSFCGKFAPIVCYENIDISNATMNLKGHDYGIDSWKKVSISNAIVDIDICEKNDNSVGILGKGSVVINNANVSIKSRAMKGICKGITTEGADSTVTINNSNVNIEGVSDVNICNGINSVGIVINGGQVDVNCKGVLVDGIFTQEDYHNSTKGTLDISNDAQVSITAEVLENKAGATFGENDYTSGIFLRNTTMNVTSGDVNVNIKDNINDDFISGILLEANCVLNMSGGKIDVTADVYMDASKTYGDGEAISIYDTTTMNVTGGKIGIHSNSLSLPSLHVFGKLNVSGGIIEAINTGYQEDTGGSAIILDNKKGSSVLTINGGAVVAQGKGQAIIIDNMNSLKMNTDGGSSDYSVSVITASTDYDGKNLVDYDEGALSTYKYMEIGRVYKYSLKFDASVADISQAMKKVAADGTETVITNSELPGWRAVEEGGKKILILEGLDFVTAKVKECSSMKEYQENNNEAGALMITGDATVRLADNTYNRIGVVRNDFESENYCYGIMSAGVLTVEGYGELDIKCKEYYFFGIHGKDNIIFKGGVINENLDCKGATGIRNDKNLTINKGTILNINVNSMSQALGIMSENLVKITGGEVNIILNDKQGESGELYSIGILSNDVIEVAGGNIDIKSMSQGDLEYYNGIYCYSSYSQTAGIVHIDCNNTTGIYTYSGDINIVDGTLEITAKKAMNKVPKVTASNVSISEYKSTTDIEMQYTGGAVRNVPSYSHVIIEPHYFLKYSGGKIYKCTNTNETLTADKVYTNDAIKIDSATNTITLDNFVFTTSHRRGLYTTEDITINLAEGSKNSIATKLSMQVTKDQFLADESGNYVGAAIYGNTESLTIQGNGNLYLSNNLTSYVESEGIKSCTGIYANNLNINGGNIDIRVKTEDKINYQGKLIFCNNNINIKGGNIEGYSASRLSRGLSADQKITIDSNYNGNIYMQCKGTNIHNITGNEGVYIYGGNIILENKLGEDMENIPDVYGIYAKYGDNGNGTLDKIIIGKKDSSNKVNLTINNNHRGNSRGVYSYGDLSIYNSVIEFTSNSNQGTNVVSEKDYGLYSKQKNITIEDSSIDIVMTSSNSAETKGICGNAKASITNTDIRILNTKYYGIDVKDKLTLDGVNATINASKAIYMDGTTPNITILGENTVTSTYSGTDTDYYGIYSKGNITLQGTGKLNIDYESGASQTNPYTAIYSEGSITIQEADITASGNKYGIYSSDTITITSGTIKAYAYCKSTNASESIGIKGINEVTINGGTITVEAESANSWAGGISTTNSTGGIITITGGTIDVKTTNNSNNSVAMYSGKLNISGGDIKVYASGETTYAIQSKNNDINITGGKVTATVTGENCTGIDGKNINIKNGEVNISSKVKGIHASNVINIADCTLTVTSEANNEINVIDSDVAESDSGTPITIDNATVTITGGASDKVLSKSDSKAPIFSKTKIVEIKKHGDTGITNNESGILWDNNSSYNYIKIIPYGKVISVDITWGDMDFKYSESNWNASNHDYDTKIWSNNTTDGDKITISNNATSTVPVKASIAYNKSTGYEGITGTILQTKEPSTAFTNGTTITVGSSLNAYLALDGRLHSSATSRTTIGNVTVTISE